MLRCFYNGDKKAILERDDDLLTPEDRKEFAEEVRAAMLEELKRWSDQKIGQRYPRKKAGNIVDCI